ncbi:hypothetical protein IW143_002680 [Coemansia sp. RSA 520]|nr:hypothetical protein GGH17_001736 [Coemansia sp. RSA 788]KAJ2189764.1 hypothetical protein EV181_001431 [Coemansia sp. RSA 532]KAJ2198894.1 hypothetical protein IW144_001714 [Coemansia sp. RSA 522]KAJ2219448.1 hypothetical protein IW143_002680 [Coemansia sp. RSA 520]KAJ2420315.1 hypothetical protein GGF47_004360 [Coemansia sp. RSA 2524]
MSCFEARAIVKTRSVHTGQQQMFRVLGAGAYCVVCEKCQHRSMVSPNITQALLCTHCSEQLTIPLGAHFMCPANLLQQFAVMQPFDIERFLAHQGHELRSAWMQLDEKAGPSAIDVTIGFMDAIVSDQSEPSTSLLQGMCGMQKQSRTGVLAALAQAWAGFASKSRSQHLLAVATPESMSWYAIHTSIYGGEPWYERVLEISLAEAHTYLPERKTAAHISVSSWQGTVKMDLGADTVGRVWLRALNRPSQDAHTLVGNGMFDNAIVAPQNPDIHNGSHAAIRLVPI